MTACGYFWTIVVILLAMAGVTASAIRGNMEGKTTPHPAMRPPSPQGEGKRAEAPGPVAYRRGGARYVTCQASTRLDDGYIVTFSGRSGAEAVAEMQRYAKKELAAILAEQALAAGGIEFTQVGGELRAVMRTVTGKAEEDV